MAQSQKTLFLENRKIMQRVVISTVGTSLLTNQIKRETENTWYGYLRDTANLSQKEIDEKHPDVAEMIRALQERASKKLDSTDIRAIRLASAELNGIYGLYKGDLELGRTNRDVHWLIATDTCQGTATAKIVTEFLQKQGISADYYAPPELSTASTEKFSNGIDNLITWLEENIVPYKQSHYKICFNLVGSFKSLQGYLNTIGMFYADEIIYIFEGQDSALITIPRLPIAVDYSVIEPYKVQLALMDAGAVVPATSVPGIPEAMVYPPGEEELILSTWGQLVWKQCKQEMLSQELLPFPKLQYRPSFVADYRNIRDKGERVKLQEALAKVSCLLNKSNDGLALLAEDKGLKYSRYKNSNKIDHFRVDLSQRVSCEAVAGEVVMRYYGSHAHVQGKELS